MICPRRQRINSFKELQQLNKKEPCLALSCPQEIPPQPDFGSFLTPAPAKSQKIHQKMAISFPPKGIPQENSGLGSPLCLVAGWIWTFKQPLRALGNAWVCLQPDPPSCTNALTWPLGRNSRVFGDPKGLWEQMAFPVQKEISCSFRNQVGLLLEVA